MSSVIHVLDPKEMRAVALYEARRTMNKRTKGYKAVCEEISKREQKANRRIIGSVAR